MARLWGFLIGLLGAGWLLGTGYSGQQPLETAAQRCFCQVSGVPASARAGLVLRALGSAFYLARPGWRRLLGGVSLELSIEPPSELLLSGSNLYSLRCPGGWVSSFCSPDLGALSPAFLTGCWQRGGCAQGPHQTGFRAICWERAWESMQGECKDKAHLKLTLGFFQLLT